MLGKKVETYKIEDMKIPFEEYEERISGEKEEPAFSRESYKRIIISPNQENAFSEPVLHALVLSKIDFALSDKVWTCINEGFTNYWNNEVGFGNYPYYNEAANSIDTWLKKDGIVFSYNKIVLIVEIVFGFIEKIPGVLLDDDAIVIQPQ